LLSHPFGRAKGKVYFVGAGPGNADLLTVRAVRILGLASVVLHDALVSAEVLTLISSQARIVNVGKRCGQKSITQEEINELLIRYAARGEIVVRLKSGDPLVFGRAGEELDVLKQAAVDVEIVPGVTAALAAAASMKVSLTDRRSAEQILIVSAHRGRGKQDSDWHQLVRNRTTVVVYMPGQCAGIAQDLRRAGVSGSTPCAIVSKVSSPEEQWYQTTLASLECAPRMPAPCILIVGETLGTSRDLRSLCVQSVFPDGSLNFGNESPV
jgi:uroporphyrin-III C-methyltransferase